MQNAMDYRHFSMSKYLDILDNNEKTLEHLDPGQYPALTAYFRRTGGLRVLTTIMLIMAGYDHPLHLSPRTGKAWFAISRSFMMHIGGGSPNTWNSAIIYLTHIGLLERIRPSASTTIPAIRRLHEAAAARGTKA